MSKKKKGGPLDEFWKLSHINKDGRFKLSKERPDSDDYLNPDRSWTLTYARTGKTAYYFEGLIDDETTTQEVKFSPDGKEVIAKNGNGNVLKRVSLPSVSKIKFINSVEKGDIDKVSRLIKKGVDVNAKDLCSGETVLIKAAKNGYLDIVKLLLENDADINAKDERGKAALDKAKHGNHDKVIQLLEAAMLTKSKKKKVSKKIGKKSICAQCKKTFGGERKKKHCRECNKNYCESHFKIGGWGRFHITSDDDTRSVACPKGHQYLEDESGELYLIG